MRHTIDHHTWSKRKTKWWHFELNTFIDVSFIKERNVLFAQQGLLVYRFVLCHVFILSQLSSPSVSRNVTLNTDVGNYTHKGSNWVGAACIHFGSVVNDNTGTTEPHFLNGFIFLYSTHQAFFVCVYNLFQACLPVIVFTTRAQLFSYGCCGERQRTFWIIPLI